MKASLRMWRAAARQGSEEACLRIGDFFYYGREYGDNEILDRFTERKFMYKNSPYPWIQYLVYPEDLLQGFARHLIPHIASLVRQISSKRDSILPSVCTEGTQSSDTSCSALYGVTNDTLQSNHTRDLGIAVQYYRQAAEQHGSPRANFNLGNMYEWGMGLRQDFPMAKRHYDLAGTARSKEAAVAVQLALFCMNIHEALVRLKLYMESALPTLLTSHR
jgi:SEL1 protein